MTQGVFPPFLCFDLFMKQVSMFQSACNEHADSKLKIISEEDFTEVSVTTKKNIQICQCKPALAVQCFISQKGIGSNEVTVVHIFFKTLFVYKIEDVLMLLSDFDPKFTFFSFSIKPAPEYHLIIIPFMPAFLLHPNSSVSLKDRCNLHHRSCIRNKLKLSCFSLGDKKISLLKYRQQIILSEALTQFGCQSYPESQ